jgi:phage gpG-like protein
MTGETQCDSLEDAVRVLAELKDRAQNVPVEYSLLQAAEIVEERTVLNFAQEEDPAGNPWMPVKRQMPPPILFRTGLLSRLAQQAARNPQITGDSLLIDASEPYYGKFHLLGGVKLPKREWLGFTDDHVDQMTALASDNAVAFVLTGEQ